MNSKRFLTVAVTVAHISLFLFSIYLISFPSQRHSIRELITTTPPSTFNCTLFGVLLLIYSTLFLAYYWGVHKRNHPELGEPVKTYVQVALVLFFFVMLVYCIVTIVLGSYQKGKTMKSFESVFIDEASNFGNNNQSTIHLQTVQTKLQCCGLLGANDYPQLKERINDHLSIERLPSSCCSDGISWRRSPSTKCLKSHLKFTKGCLEQMQHKYFAPLQLALCFILAVFFATLALVVIFEWTGTELFKDQQMMNIFQHHSSL